MAFRKVWYLIPSCDGCGLAWSFGDPACADSIPPHFTSPAAALGPLAADYGWHVVPRRLGRPLMACRRCAAAGVIPGNSGRRWLLAVAGWARRYVPFGPVRRVTRRIFRTVIRNRQPSCCGPSRRTCWPPSTTSCSPISDGR